MTELGSGSPEPSPRAEVRETHVSYVFLFDDLAVKLKKPVRFAFLDFSTRERRAEACRREVALNRRLAPDVYLGVYDVLGPDGTPSDHLVVMRRMPDERRLAALARAGAVEPEQIRDLAHALAAFHARADRSPEIARAASVEAVRDRWVTGFDEIAPFVGDLVDTETEREIERLAHRYLDGREELLEARIASGRACDGHGDLLADDVFLLADGPRVLDCLEFADELRYGDALADLAFLVMDLERVGAPDLAEQLATAYRDAAAEHAPDSLLHHYVAFRAHIRAKVACLRAAQGDAAAAESAPLLLDCCLAHLRRGRVALVLVGGGPGTGKSTLAAGLADALGWTVLRSDEVRKDLVGLAHTEHAPAPLGEGIYDVQTTAATYAELLARARMLLARGESVVLDASWGTAATRADAAALAEATAADLVELCCEAPESVTTPRIAARVRAGTDASDASPEIARALAERADPWPSATTIHTSGDVEASLSAARRAVELPVH